MRDDETPRLRRYARNMRHESTDAEAVLWSELRNRGLNKLKFRRQVPIASYIVDFVCIEKKLIVEVDGSQHAVNIYDKQRDERLKEQGYIVLRFWNDDIIRDLKNVCQHIIAVSELGSKNT
ncbi:endonuclease domain-containing protein [Ahrensia sp. 13_GOM-1096m]|uniref:endonuclease domain-containing protein n=1 Tax=Ahrensia sp. 13_GOM-1096m TaxID=1380380 RepID=UPI00047AC471|nr:DUF559 domain-containing protein [Ahrensia sp. 13_GOM-1096m]